MKLAKFSRIVEAAKNYREAFPWCYRLSCGHYFYGNKGEWVRSGVVHQQVMRCGLCSTGYPEEHFETEGQYANSGFHSFKPVAEWLPK